MASFFNSKFCENFPLILNNNDNHYDTLIQVGALSSSWAKKENGMIIFNKPNITPNIFDIILRYIYTGKMDLIEQLSDILKLSIASDELLLEELFEYLRDYLTEQRHNWILRVLILVFNTVHKHANCEFLQNYCFETICFIHPVSLIASDKFPSLDRYALLFF
ncbi:uncharacterized protein OCT59_005909 [Rhizophagus irregularis]|uniref:uncharacterized protein n=1 Tax=Rhizophagus irregularis TaxID=588596 RepID=UPI00332E2668|nr:hypothetical protein OCT59_005909 [Rhizophagus irregularis]